MKRSSSVQFCVSRATINLKFVIKKGLSIKILHPKHSAATKNRLYLQNYIKYTFLHNSTKYIDVIIASHLLCKPILRTDTEFISELCPRTKLKFLQTLFFSQCHYGCMCYYCIDGLLLYFHCLFFGL